MAKYTPAYLKKLEELLEVSGYDVRYEKGNFKSNFCILEAKKVVVINKFTVLESRIQSLIEIIQTLSAQQAIHADLRSVGLKNPIQTPALNFSQTDTALDGMSTENHADESLSENRLENASNS
ncbi:MAG: hypothetical protein JNL88_09445 [Bacteroidia bacterium]|nr:hypothetical protein [Bacteroidia bacterium]